MLDFLKKPLVYLLISLIVFIAGMLALDTVNSDVNDDMEVYKEYYENILEEQEAKEATLSPQTNN